MEQTKLSTMLRLKEDTGRKTYFPPSQNVFYDKHYSGKKCHVYNYNIYIYIYIYPLKKNLIHE